MIRGQAILLALVAITLIGCTTSPDATSQPSRVGSSNLAAPTLAPTPTPIPTPTPNPDSDNDGLTDVEERAAGTNPFQKDSDVDGLDDAAEMSIGSDPLFPDTDRDGIVDGDDVNPLNDLAVELTLLEFTDHTQRAILSFFDSLDAYLILSVDDQQKKIPFNYTSPVVFDVPDDSNKAIIRVRAYEGEGDTEALTRELVSGFVPILRLFETKDELYDISGVSGKATLNREIDLSGTGNLPALAGNGLDYGVIDDHSRHQAEVVVGIKVGRLQNAR